jgi:DNA polymerase-3 subunit epsilon
MSLDFTAIDFETANSNRGSPCSVALVRVRGGQVVGESSTLIRPPARYGHFDRYNTWLHGIGAEMVADAPTWREAVGWIAGYTGSDTLVCHNAGFDMSVLQHACAADEISCPPVDFLCTLVLARRAFRLPSYSLPFVASQCDVELGRHHQAIEDARCAALIAVAMARKQDARTLAGLSESLGVRIRHMNDGWYAPGGRGRGGSASRLIRMDVGPGADPDHPFYGQVIVFTGALMSRSRQMAWDDVVEVGGIPELSVTKRTNVLVIGEVRPGALAPGAAITGKAAKAFDLQAKGQEIEVMTEDDFLRSL